MAPRPTQEDEMLRSNTARAAVGLGTIAVIVVLFVVLSGGDDNGDKNKTTTTSTTQTNGGTVTTGAPRQETILVRDAKPVGGIKELEYNKGDQVRLTVDSDTADEIHVHGYDFKKDVAAGGKVRFDFPASIDGVFEIELENKRQQIAELKVNP
jgi:hypothetical protein